MRTITTRSRLHRALVAGFMMTLLASMLPAAAASSGTGQGSALDVNNDALISGAGLNAPTYVETLAGDMVFATYEGGVSVIAHKGSTVSYGESVRGNGKGQTIEHWVEIEPPAELEEPAHVSLASDRPSVVELAHQLGLITDEDLAEFARTDRIDAMASGDLMPMTHGFFDEGFAQVDNSTHQIFGVYRRYHGGVPPSGGRYYGQRSQASAKSNRTGYYMYQAFTQHSYSNGNGIVTDWRPLNSVSYGSCASRTLSLAAKGVSMSTTRDICPERLSNDTTSKRHYVDWYNRCCVYTATRSTHALDIIRSASSGSTGFAYSVRVRSRVT